MSPFAAIAVAGCVAIGAGSDEVRVRDLALAFSGGAALPFETVVGLAPAPGVVRRFEIAELRRLALRLDLPEPEREVCVERPVARLAPERILAAMRAQFPEARIELLEFSLYPVPAGELEFPRAALRAMNGGAVWRGSVLYGVRHRAPVWARVKISAAAPRVVAAANLPAGKPIDPALLKIETRDEFPDGSPFPSDPTQVEGRVPRRPIRAGAVILAAWLEDAKAVIRGETVDVEVRQGGAFLKLAGLAQSSGTVGQTILVLNPMSNRRFPARVEGKGKVSAGGSQ